MTKINIGIHGIIELNHLPLKEQLKIVSKEFPNEIDGFEIFLFPNYVYNDHNKDKETIVEILNCYMYNTFHIYSNMDWMLGNNRWTRLTYETIQFFWEKGIVQRAVVHPDFIQDMDDFYLIVKDTGVKTGVETLGKSSKWGNKYEQIRDLLYKYEDLDLVADIAHIYEMAENTNVSVEKYIDSFSRRLNQIHFSAPGNYYGNIQGIKDKIETPHSFVSIKWNDIKSFLPCFDRLKHLLFTIEGVVPSGKLGRKMLLNEIELIRETSSPKKHLPI